MTANYYYCCRFTWYVGPRRKRSPEGVSARARIKKTSTEKRAHKILTFGHTSYPELTAFVASGLEMTTDVHDIKSFGPVSSSTAKHGNKCIRDWCSLIVGHHASDDAPVQNDDNWCRNYRLS
jgi:hypothetical protein